MPPKLMVCDTRINERQHVSAAIGMHQLENFTNNKTCNHLRKLIGVNSGNDSAGIFSISIINALIAIFLKETSNNPKSFRNLPSVFCASPEGIFIKSVRVSGGA